MANRGWDSQLAGDSWASTARTTGRLSGTDGAAGFVQGDKVAHNGMVDNDALAGRDDVFGPPGQGSTCSQ